MEFFDLSLKGLKVILPKVHKDPRGFFFESFRKDALKEHGITCDFVQDNHSFSRKNTIRGMHFCDQDKLVRVGSGRIYDVAVDIREGSPTFGCWQGVYLDDDENKMLFIPKGFAHGFAVLSDEAHVLYKVSQYYDVKTERGFRYDDPEVGISWPIDHPIVSERDIACPRFSDVFSMR